MSAILLDQVLTKVRSDFSRTDVADVLPYGGEFSGAEIARLSFTAPAVLVTVLGWRAAPHDARLVGRHVRELRLAAFVVTKHAQRAARLAQAMTLAERLALGLRLWVPDSTGLPLTAAPLEREATCENLYGRAVDEAGLALWLVSWEQCVRPVVPLPQLWDLLAVDITDKTREGVVPAASTDNPSPLVVTEDVRFTPT